MDVSGPGVGGVDVDGASGDGNDRRLGLVVVGVDGITGFHV